MVSGQGRLSCGVMRVFLVWFRQMGSRIEVRGMTLVKHRAAVCASDLIVLIVNRLRKWSVRIVVDGCSQRLSN